MWIPDHLTYLLNAGQEATVRTGHGTTDWFQIGKGVRQGCILSPCLFNLYAEYVMRNTGLDESQAGIKIARRNINNLRYARWYHSSGRKWRGPEEPPDESERREWKASLKLNIQKTKIMASCPKTSWQIEGGKGEAVTDFIFLGSKITADGDCNHEIKRHMFLGRKVTANLDSLLKSRDVPLPLYRQSYGFSSSLIWMWELDHKENWMLKNWCFWTVMLEKTLRVPWTA